MSEDFDDKPLSPKAQAAIAALDYASPSLKQSSERVPAAEQAIDRRASLRVTARSLGKPSVAAAYLRRSLARRHAIATAGDACVGCGATTPGVIGVRWTFVVPIRFLRSLIGEKPAVEAVETYHAMCGDCAQRPFRRQRRARWLTRVAIAGIALGLGVLGAGLYWFWEGKSENTARWILGIGALTLLAPLAAIWAAKFVARQSVPRRLRNAVPRWLTFEAWQGWFDRTVV